MSGMGVTGDNYELRELETWAEWFDRHSDTQATAWELLDQVSLRSLIEALQQWRNTGEGTTASLLAGVVYWAFLQGPQARSTGALALAKLISASHTASGAAVIGLGECREDHDGVEGIPSLRPVFEDNKFVWECTQRPDEHRLVVWEGGNFGVGQPNKQTPGSWHS